jgi:cellulose synthase/poly-beta-1,6-N-acetylglucosamine synthase-like glycosyltransferase
MSIVALGIVDLIGGLLIVLGLAYAAIIGGFAAGFRRVLARERTPRSLRNGHLPFVSVVVPARDEEAYVERCLRSIIDCDYPEDFYEIVVVDDLSRDATAAVVRRVIAEMSSAMVLAGGELEETPAEDSSRLRLLSMPENIERTRAHKKRAITKGVDAARGSIILTTDADCTVPRGWIREMASAFEEDVALVSGPVLYPLERQAARDVQALEFLGLVAVGAGAIGAGRPNLCNGANVAYRKEVFDAMGGFAGIDHLTSGDDELLMQKIAYTTSWRIRFCAGREAAVETEGAPSVPEFIQQRKRWASKGSHYPHTPLKLTIGAIYAFYVLLLVSAGAVLAGAMSPWVLVAAVGLKILPEAGLLWPACRHYGRARLMTYFLPVQPIHALYIVGMGAAGAIGGYTWKDRQISR